MQFDDWHVRAHSCPRAKFTYSGGRQFGSTSFDVVYGDNIATFIAENDVRPNAAYLSMVRQIAPSDKALLDILRPNAGKPL
jgi:hypothetical protein